MGWALLWTPLWTRQKKKIVHVKIADGSPEGLLVQVDRWTASAGNEYVNWQIMIGWQSGNVWAHKAYPLALRCCLPQRRPSQLPTGLISTIVQQLLWKQQRQTVRQHLEE